MNYDLLIKNGSIIDGTGSSPKRADLAIKDGIIVSIGEIGDESLEVIDATNLVVSPGFIDIHTHFDPQLCWDGYATPSVEHGITTVVTGNCSLSLAPIRGKEDADKIVSMFGVIEDIKKATFDEAVPFSWQSFPEYLDHIRPKLGVNVGALIGHSAIRLFVMGQESQKRAATEEEIQKMCNIVKDAMQAGALGISSSYVDIDENGDPVPSRFADINEKLALAKAMAESGRGIWQVVPYFPDMKQQLDNIRELGDISLHAEVACSFQPVISSPVSPDAKELISALEQEQERGARVYGQSMPRCFDLNMRLSETSMLLYALPGWKKIMDLPRAQRIEKFQNERSSLVEEMKTAQGFGGSIPFLKVGSVKTKENQAYEGRYLAEIAQEEEKEIGEVILDLAINDNLDTEFQLQNVINADKQAVAKIVSHPLCHFGASDAGAHITQFCGTGDTSHLLEHYVRETKTFTLEEAIHKMTGELAADWGLADRGTLEEGKAADITIFDPDNVAAGKEEFVDDFPGEARRYIRKSKGYKAVVVNGEVAYQDGRYTNNLSGKVV